LNEGQKIGRLLWRPLPFHGGYPKRNLWLSCLSVPVAIITVMIMVVPVLMAPFPITPLLVLI